MNECELDICVLRPDQEDEVFCFLALEFFPYEPLNVALKRVPRKEQVPALSHVKNGLSLAAYIGQGDERKLVGVIINTIAKRGEECLVMPTDPDALKIYKILQELDKRADIWNRIQCDQVFHLVLLTTNSEYRQKKIAAKLMEETMNLARSLGEAYLVVECTNVYSARVAERTGFEKVHEFRYEDHKDEKGHIVFRTEPPHFTVSKWIKKIK